MRLVFVYGTLKQGFGNYNRLLATSEFVSNHSTQPEYTMFDLGSFPGVKTNGVHQIHGEIYSVEDCTFKRLDQLEGYPNFYNRIEIPTPYGDAWMYVLNRDYGNKFRVIEGGVW